MVIVEWIIGERRYWLGREHWTLEAVLDSLSRAGWHNVTVEMHAKRTSVIVMG